MKSFYSTEEYFYILFENVLDNPMKLLALQHNSKLMAAFI